MSCRCRDGEVVTATGCVRVCVPLECRIISVGCVTQGAALMRFLMQCYDAVNEMRLCDAQGQARGSCRFGGRRARATRAAPALTGDCGVWRRMGRF